MLRLEDWSRLAGESPVRVSAGAPGSRPRFVVERRRAERGVKSLFGGSKRAGCDCSLVKSTMGEPSRSSHGEGHVRQSWFRIGYGGSPRGTGSCTRVKFGPGQGRPVCVALSAKTVRISRVRNRAERSGSPRGSQ